MAKIPENVKIGIVDWKHDENESNEIKTWIRKYNIKYYFSSNISCLSGLSEAKNLKILILDYFPYCEEREMNIFLQLKDIHSFKLSFNESVV